MTGACRRVTAAQPIRALLLRLAYPVRFVVFLSACLVVGPVGSGRIFISECCLAEDCADFFCVPADGEFPVPKLWMQVHHIQLILILSLVYVRFQR